MKIFYNKNIKTHKYNLYTPDINKQRTKYRIHCRSFIFKSLFLCVFSLFYISLWNVYDENIVPLTKYIDIVSRNLSEFQNENNNDMKRKNTVNHLDKTNENSQNSYNNETVTLENKHYNDMSKNLSRKELFDVLNSLKECPSNEDLRNIWFHTVDIAKEGLDNLLKESKTSIQKYLDNNIHISTDKYGNKTLLYEKIWNEYISRFSQEVEREEVEYTNEFFSLINDKHTLDDILKFIYSFLEYFEILKKILQEEYHEELLRTIVENMNEKK
ncbi:Plasmodium exported protein (PHISTa), unknown function [Plasmodium sp. gorilla clade G2]|uniref:Plasmodium exported protein (PHISTa), unknown function n=1 Tax=Plasmodium sp. gorilla clade G2 TaxID=880535 RepID=UPI000D214906|nr:Plasmodium exported protein (PHISTa), unknown function [Plasmodium sp. gorilla clade G2]SOV12747.1 Plasmodium exported protein (PHISTa), unknown function [Plasmodium sp. gorilla clade G2]